MERGGPAVHRRPGTRQPGLPRRAQLRGGGGRADPARRAGAAQARSPRGRGHLRRDPGLVAVRAQRAHPGIGALPVQAGLVRRPARRTKGRAEPRRPAGRGRRLQRGADRRRRVGPGGVRRLDPRHPAGTTGAGRPARPRAARHRAQADEGAAPVHLLGLPRGRLSQGHGHAHRPGLRQQGRCRTGWPGRTWTGRPARATPRPTTHRWSWTWTKDRARARRCRTAPRVPPRTARRARRTRPGPAPGSGAGSRCPTGTARTAGRAARG